ncbi:MAG: energy-coupling factor transport system ATP-binding protein [Desulforhopalus sp.]|jgi:energy-coupling factor transport system ATP-binding protein
MLIRVDDLSFTYGDSVAALQNISFEISAGERVALTGHNGSGKSTLVKHLNGLLQPSAGKIWIAGQDTTLAKTAQLAGQVALLFQNPDDQICKRTVWDEIVFGPKNLNYSTKRIESLAEDALALFELTPFKRKNPHDFGYSERKRIAMASIVAMDTPILVFDEPTAGLDPYEISLLIATLQKLQSENKTVIVISHDMDFVAENISRVISLAGGRKMFDGRARDLFRQPALMTDCRLRQPQVTQLSNACALRCTALSSYECATEIEDQLR